MTTYRPEPAGLDKLSITAKTLVTAAVGDHVLIADLSDSSNLKKVTVQTIVDIASAGNAATVTTNANLTGHVTSVGNAAVLGLFTKAQLDAAVSDDNVAYVGTANTFSQDQTISKANPSLSLLASTNTSPSVLFTNSAKIVSWNLNSAGEFFVTDVSTGPSRLFVGTGGSIGIGDYYAASNLPQAKLSVAGTATIGYSTSASVTVPSNGLAVSGAVTSSGLTTTAASSATVAAIVKGAAAQSANLQEWQNSAGTVLASVSPAGNLTVSGVVNTTAIRDGGAGDHYMSSITRDTAGNYFALNANGLRCGSSTGLMWQSGISVYGAHQTSLSQNAAGVIQIGTTANNALGSLLLTNLTASGTAKLGIYTVATLPSASSNPYAEANVSDALTPAMGSTVAGGGAVKTKVRSNGTDWTVAGI